MQRYKAREKAVVAEVMAMTIIPGGLTRDEYLRQRLQLSANAPSTAAEPGQASARPNFRST